jgi:hypothetical protein
LQSKIKEHWRTLIHDYFGIDIEAVWDTVRNTIPAFKKQILKVLKFLLDKSYEVFGTYRRLSTPNFWRLQYLDIFEKVNLIPADLVDAGSMVEAVKISYFYVGIAL